MDDALVWAIGFVIIFFPVIIWATQKGEQNQRHWNNTHWLKRILIGAFIGWLVFYVIIPFLIAIGG